MRVLDRLLDARNTADGKALSIMLSVLLAVSMVNFAAFASSENAKDKDAAIEQVDSNADDQSSEQESTDQSAAEQDAVEQQPEASEPPEAEQNQPAAESEPEKAEPADNSAGQAEDKADESKGEASNPQKDTASAQSGNKVDEASVAFVTEQAYIEILGETLQMPETMVKVKVGKDLTFKAFPNNGRQIDVVYANDQVLTAQQPNEYVVPAIMVNSKLVVKVTTREAQTDSDSKSDGSSNESDDESDEADDQSETIVGSTELSSLSDEAGDAEATDDDAEAADGDEPESNDADADEAPAFDATAEHVGGVFGFFGGMGVTASAAAGVFPAETTMTVSPATLSADAIAQIGNSYKAVDITFHNAQGKEIEPNGSVSISISGINVSGSQVGVYHVTDGGAVETIAEGVENTGAVSFDASEFSVYAVGAKKTATYQFSVDGTIDQSLTQTVVEGETIYEPQAPEKDGYFFQGWYNGETKFEFGAQGALTEDAAITLTAKFAAGRYVFYVDATGAVASTEAHSAGQTFALPSTLPTLASDEGIVSFTDDEGNVYSAGANFTMPDGNVTMTASVAKGHWLTFDTNSKYTVIASQFYLPNATTVAPITPEKAGYTFDGWKNGSTAFTFGGKLTSNVDLKASWKANTNTKYTVVHWQENANDDGYSFKDSEQRSGTTTAKTKATAKTYAGFTAKSITQATIAGDGSTVVNVYYTRNTYTLTFKANKKTVATITAKQGAKIFAKFSEAPFATTYRGRAWKATSLYGYALQTLDVMPGQNVTFNIYAQSSNTLKTINYYGEALPDQLADKVYKDKNYVLLKSVPTYFNYMTYEEEYHNIEGFARWTASAAGFSNSQKKFSNNVGDLYYDRDSYNIEFHNGSTTDKTVSKKYEASIADANYTPKRPAGVPEGYVFDGWYDNEAGAGEKFVFDGKTMPANNMVLFAKWTAPTYKATVHATFEVDGEATTISVEFNNRIDPEQLPQIVVPEGKTFLGWSTTPNNVYTPFNINDVLSGDVTLYPCFMGNSTYTVTYDVNGGKGSVTDSKQYAEHSSAQVKSAQGVTKSGKVFLGWKCGDQMYYPGDKVAISGNLTFVAQWGEKEQAIAITYHSNLKGDDVTATENHKRNSTFAAAGIGAIPNYEYDVTAYQFEGWATSAAATAVEFAPGDQIAISSIGSNDLYGVWSEIVTVPVHYYLNDTTYEVAASGATASAKAGTTVVASPISIDDYTAVSTEQKSATAGAEGVSIDFYYYKNVELTANSDTQVYNGSEQSVAGFTVAGLLEGHQANFTSITVGAKGTNVGEYPAVFDASVKGTVDVTGKYLVANAVSGKLTITPVSAKVTVTVTEKSDTITYDGKEHGVSGYETIAADNPKYDVSKNVKETSTAAWTAKGTDAGTYEVGIVAGDFQNTSKNFANVEFVIVDGSLVIDPVKDKVTVTVTENSGTATYDGKEHSVSGYETIAADTDLYDTSKNVKEAATAAWTAKGTDAGTYEVGIVAGDFRNTSKNFSDVEFVIVDGSLVIDPVKDKVTVTVTENGGTATYDGDEHSITGYATIAADNALYPTADSVKETETAAWTAKGTDAGTYEVGIEAADFRNTSKNFTNVEFVIADGSLVIDPVSAKVTVTVTEKSDTITYDGDEHSITGYATMVADNALYDVTASVEKNETAAWTAKGTDQGTYPVGIESTDFRNTNKNFSDVEFKVVDGSLSIVGSTGLVTVTVTEKSGTATYDGKEHSVYGYETIVSDNPKYDVSKYVKATATAAWTAKGTDAGTYEVGIKDTDFQNTSANFINVRFVIVPGSLVISPVKDKVTVTVTEKSGIATYDGKEHSVSGYETIAADNALYPTADSVKETETAAWTAKGTDAGTYEVGIEAADFRNTSKNFTNVEFVIADGSLVIDPVKDKVTVTVTEKSDTITYDGDEHSITGYATMVADNDLYDTSKNVKEAATAAWTAKGTDAGTYEVGIVADDFENMNGNFSNVEFVIVDGSLVIDPVKDKVTVTVTEKSSIDNVYDGTQKSITGYAKVESSNALYDVTTSVKETATAAWTARGTDAGTYEVGIVAGDFRNTSKNFANVEFKVIDGSLIIGKRDVTFIGQSQTHTYTDQTIEINDVDVEGLVSKQTSNVAYSAAGIAVGTYPGTITAADKVVIKAGETDVTKNYNVTTNPGVLTIKASQEAWTIALENAEYTYDGTAKHNENVATTSAGGSTTYQYTMGDQTSANLADLTQVDAGVYTISVTATNPNYSEPAVTTATLTINPRPVTLTSATDSKVYNDKPLTNKTVTVGGAGFVNGDGASYDVTGTQTLVGTSQNTFTYALNQNVKSSNYTITPVEGTLTVTDGDKDQSVDPGKVITKTHETAQYQLGETVEFTITAKNIYAEPKTLTIVEQPGVTIVGQSVFEAVEPGATITAKAIYEITEKDILAGGFTNTVNVEFDEKSWSATDSVDTKSAEPGLSMTKTSDVKEYASLGQTITYTITVKNTGNVTVKDIQITDELTGNVDNRIWGLFGANDTKKIAELAPGASADVTVTYDVTADDVEKGQIQNTATARGTDPSGQTVEPEGPATATDKVKRATLTVEKTVKGSEVKKPSDVVTYAIKVTNTGNVDLVLADAALVDEKAPAGTKFNKETLVPGDFATAQYEYKVSQSELNAGLVENAAFVTAQDPDGDDVSGEAEESITTRPDPTDPDKPYIKQNPKLTVDKSADQKSDLNDGDVITYTITVTNAGNVNIANIVVSDPMTGLTKVGDWSAFELAPGASKELKATYTVSLSDIDRGTPIANTATAKGIDPSGKPTDPAEGATSVIPASQKPALTTTKTHQINGATPFAGQKVQKDDVITYTITVANSGNVTVSGISITDTMSNGVQLDFGDQQMTDIKLAPGEKHEVSASYTVTQADIDAQKPIANVATATGTSPSDEETTSEPATDPTTPVESAPELTVVKTADPAANVKKGDTITYTIKVTNIGNVTVSGIAVDDPMTGLTKVGDWSAFELAPGAFKELKATYTVKQSDIDAGAVLKNTATAKGDDPSGKPIDPVEGTTDVTPEVHKPALTVVKTSDKEGERLSKDDVITYTITVVNNGNATLKDISITDQMSNGAQLDFGQQQLTDIELAPGERHEVSASYTVTQADIDAQAAIANAATAQGTDPKDNEVVPDNPGTTENKVEEASAILNVDKVATGNASVKVGDQITYVVTIVNNGNVTLATPALDDAMAPAGTKFDAETLAPGATAIATYTYKVTQADLDAGVIENTANVTTTDPSGDNVTGTDTETITDQPDPSNPDKPTITQRPHLTTAKTLVLGERPANGKAYVPGEKVTYEITVINDGNVTLKNVVVADELAEFTSEPIPTLAPGEKKTFRASYTITKIDAIAGAFVNVATAEGVTPDGSKTELSYDEERVLTEPAPKPTPKPTPTPTSDPDPDPEPAPPRDNTPELDVINAISIPGRVIDDVVKFNPSPEQLDDEETPLAGHDCWVHWYIMLGILLTIVYGLVVATRRQTNKRCMKRFHDRIAEGNPNPDGTPPSGGPGADVLVDSANTLTMQSEAATKEA